MKQGHTDIEAHPEVPLARALPAARASARPHARATDAWAYRYITFATLRFPQSADINDWYLRHALNECLPRYRSAQAIPALTDTLRYGK